LKELYYVFEIKPYFKTIKRSIKKEGKLFLWDWSEIENAGARFENLVASHLLKYCHFLSDSGQGNFDLHYLRTKEKKEIDFLITHNGIPWLPVEVKCNETSPSPSWSKLMPALKCKQGIQVLQNVWYLSIRICE